VATPTFSPPAGTYTSVQTVQISTTTTGAVIRCTIDGTPPSMRSPLCAAPLTVDSVTTLRAQAFKKDWTASAAVSGTYVINLGTTDTPTVSPPGGRYSSRVRVTLTSATSGAVIRYTTDGRDPAVTDPSVSSGGYVDLPSSVTLKARAWSDSLPVSGIRRGDYVISGGVAAGYDHSLAIKGDGTLVGWGQNGYGQVGDGFTTHRYAPVPVAVVTNVIAVTAAAYYSLALTSDNRVWSWGLNNSGQLGRGTMGTYIPTPGQITHAAMVDIVAIAAADYYALALKSDGTVLKWGEASTTPTVIADLTGVTRIAAGPTHSLALKTDGTDSGTLWVWGANGSGQLGDGTTTARTTPVATLPGVVEMAGGVNHSLAVLVDGSVSAWGANDYGQLGAGTTSTPRPFPAAVSGLADVVSVVANDHATNPFSLALKRNGTVYGWGRNLYGVIGARGAPNQTSVPLKTSPFDGAVAIAVGGHHSLAIRYDGALWAWGDNTWGQVGNASVIPNTAIPVRVTGPVAVDNQWLTGDADGDGLSTWAESSWGTDLLNPDSNGDGLLDGAAAASGKSPTNPDMDGDGVANTAEVAAGTDPFRTDTDGDSVADGADAFPLDPTRWQAPAPTPGDVTPPSITLQEPTNAVLISSVP
jgi:alpha-tubulin suppressor-like RCC1 family protein